MAHFKELTIFCLGVCFCLVVVTILSKLNFIDLGSKTYSYINTEKVIENIKEHLKDKDLKDEEINSKIIYARSIFKAELDYYYKKHNAVIFTSNKVIKGANDITNTIGSKVIEAIK